MFDWLFGKKPEQAAVPAALPAVQTPSEAEVLRARIDEAQRELAKISTVVQTEEGTLKSSQKELLDLELRAAKLNDAIVAGTASVAAGGPQADIVRVYIKQAENELSENKDKQRELSTKIQTQQSFLESVQEQRALLEEIVQHRDQRLTALEVREMTLKVNKSIAAVDSNIDDYRRGVYTAEAQHELSTGIL